MVKVIFFNNHRQKRLGEIPRWLSGIACYLGWPFERCDMKSEKNGPDIWKQQRQELLNNRNSL